MKPADICVVVAARNEARHIQTVIRGIRKAGFSHIVVVDDGSTDKTRELATRSRVVVLHHVINLGKGAAMKTGAEYAMKQKAKAIIFVDGDGQHNPEELPHFLQELNAGNDIVFGARKVRKKMPLERRVGSWILRTVIRAVYNVKLHDPLCGYRAMTAKAYKKLRWNSRDYGVESEMIARTGKEMLDYTEIEVKTIYHSRYKGMTIPDGLRIVFQLVWWRMTH